MKELIKNQFNKSVDNLLETECRITEVLKEKEYDYYELRNLIYIYHSQMFSIASMADKDFMINLHMINFCNFVIEKIDKKPNCEIIGRNYKYKTQIILDLQKMIYTINSLISKNINYKDIDLEKIVIKIRRREKHVAKSNREIVIESNGIVNVCDELDENSIIKAISPIKRIVYINGVQIIDYEIIFDDEHFIEKDTKNFIENKFLNNL